MPDHRQTVEWAQLSRRAAFHRTQISPPVFLKHSHYPWNLSLALYFLSQFITSAYLRNEKLEAIFFARALLMWTCLVLLMKSLIYDGAVTEGWENCRRKMEERGRKEIQEGKVCRIACSVYTYIPTQSLMGREETVWASHLGMPCPASAAPPHRQTRKSSSWLLIVIQPCKQQRGK